MNKFEQIHNYDLGGIGSNTIINFDRVVCGRGSKLTVQTFYEGWKFNSDDVKLSFEQSTDGINWDIVAGESYLLQSGKNSHTFNITDLVNNYIRLVVDSGNCDIGVIKKTIWLWE